MISLISSHKTVHRKRCGLGCYWYFTIITGYRKGKKFENGKFAAFGILRVPILWKCGNKVILPLSE